MRIAGAVLLLQVTYCKNAMQQRIQLIRGADGQLADALLLDIAEKHLREADEVWNVLLRQFEQEDKFWDWKFKQRLYLSRENYEGYEIECAGRTEGLLILETRNHYSQLNRQARLVYVEALVTAPWNRRDIHRPPELRGVGTILLAFARQRSLGLGYEGRVGLNALPGAESFYEDRSNMIRFDPEPEDYPDREDKPLPYFEYPPIQFGE
jgi:hypothetical protein